MLTFGAPAAAVAGLIATHQTAHAETAMLAKSQAFADILTPVTPVALAADPGAASSDWMLVQLSARIVAARQEEKDLLGYSVDVPDNDPNRRVVLSRIDALSAEAKQLAQRIGKILAYSAAGVQARATAIQAMMPTDYAEGEQVAIDWHEGMLDTLLRELASGGLAANAAPNPDAELIRLCETVLAGHRELEALWDRDADLIGDPPEEDRARSRLLVEQGHELSEQAAEMRATTFEGLRAKAAAMLTYVQCTIDGDPDWTNHDELLGWSLACDLVEQDIV